MKPAYDLDESLTDLRSIVRTYLDSQCPQESLITRPGDASLEPALLNGLSADLGLGGLLVKEDVGGAGAGYIELFVTFCELGRSLCGSQFFASTLAAEVLSSAGTDDVLDSLLMGQSGGAVAGLTWAGRTGLQASSVDGEWFIQGRSPFVVAGDSAATLAVLADAVDGLRAFVVTDPRAVTRKSLPVMDRTRPLAHLEFDRVPVRAVGDAATGAVLGDRLRIVASLMVAAEQVGAAQRCLELMVEHAKTRRQFGQPIGAFQAVKHLCAEAALSVEGAGATVFTLAQQLDSGTAGQYSVDAATCIATDTGAVVAGAALQVFGGIGFTWDHPVHMYLKRAVSSTQLFGSTSSRREIIASTLLSHG